MEESRDDILLDVTSVPYPVTLLGLHKGIPSNCFCSQIAYCYRRRASRLSIARKHPCALASGTREQMNAYHASSDCGECTPNNPIKRHAEGMDRAAEATKNKPSPTPFLSRVTFRTRQLHRGSASQSHSHYRLADLRSHPPSAFYCQARTAWRQHLSWHSPGYFYLVD